MTAECPARGGMGGGVMSSPGHVASVTCPGVGQARRFHAEPLTTFDLAVARERPRSQRFRQARRAFVVHAVRP